MTNVRVSETARQDISAILDHLEREAGQTIAVRYAVELEASLARLQSFPGLGTARPDLGAAVRFTVIDPYLLFYDFDVSRDNALILRFVHGRRRITQGLINRARRVDLGG